MKKKTLERLIQKSPLTFFEKRPRFWDAFRPKFWDEKCTKHPTHTPPHVYMIILFLYLNHISVPIFVPKFGTLSDSMVHFSSQILVQKTSQNLGRIWFQKF